MKLVRSLLILAALLLGAWLLIINGLDQFPRDSTIRQLADPIVTKVYTLFGGEEVKHFSSPEQERNLQACFDKSTSSSALPEQCKEAAACLQKMDDVFKALKVAYKGASVHRLTKVSLGWQMELLYTSPEDGDGSQKIIEHVICIANDGKVVSIQRPGAR